jgi:hypothetical protein
MSKLLSADEFRELSTGIKYGAEYGRPAALKLLGHIGALIERMGECICDGEPGMCHRCAINHLNASRLVVDTLTEQLDRYKAQFGACTCDDDLGMCPRCMFTHLSATKEQLAQVTKERDEWHSIAMNYLTSHGDKGEK